MALQHAVLHDYVCLEARGADAARFLHAQLSRAVADLPPTHAPLAGWADARGRVRALLRVCPLPERWLLVTPRDGADELLKKLRLFVLRSKVTLERAADVGVTALLGDADAWLAQLGVATDTLPNRLVRRDEVCLRSRRFGVLAAARCAGRPGTTRRRSRCDTRSRGGARRDRPRASFDHACGRRPVRCADAESRRARRRVVRQRLLSGPRDHRARPQLGRRQTPGAALRRRNRTARARRAGALGRRASRRDRA